MPREPKLPPLRPLTDFCSARFSIPPVTDPERLSSRVVRNLLYYQTNYFLTYLLIFLLFGYFHPYDVIMGGATLVFGVFAWKIIVQQCKATRRQPSKWMGMLVVVGAFVVIHFVASLAIFFLAIVLPLSAIFLHAMTRKQNLKNQLNWGMERAGLRRTIMAVLLEELSFRLDIEV